MGCVDVANAFQEFSGKSPRKAWQGIFFDDGNNLLDGGRDVVRGK
jgi:hypothetical protein